MPLRKSLRWKAASASRRSAAAGFDDLTGFGLDLGFELDRRIGEIVALERLVGGNGGDGQQQNERGCEGSANEREHGGTSIPVGRGNPNGTIKMNVKTCRGRDRSTCSDRRANRHDRPDEPRLND